MEVLGRRITDSNRSPEGNVRVHEQLSCHLHHLSEQVGSSWALQVLAQQLCRAPVVGGGHRIFSFVNLAFLKAGAVAVAVWGMLGAKHCSARVGHLGLVHHFGGLN